MEIDDIKAYEELESNRFFKRERITLNELGDNPITYIMADIV